MRLTYIKLNLTPAPEVPKRNLTKCINNSLLEIDDYVLQPVASSEAVLSNEERDLGVCLIDIGCGTTDIAIFTEGTIKHTAVIPIGSQMITNDIRIISWG